jgi:kynurenine formamidase
LTAAQWLVDHGAILIGIDSQLIDNNAATDHAIPVHKLLLANKRVICEDMTNLEAMPASGAFITAVPPRVEMASFPARVFATVYE